MTDKYNLQRFLDAQDHVYDAVLDELRAGEKSSHWMWYIFPQITGLGHSGTAQKFAITSLEETKAYLQHTILGPRLKECTQLVLNVKGHSAEQIFGAAPVHVEDELRTFSEPWTQDRVLEIGLGLFERGNGELLCHPTVTETCDLRKDVPHPVTGLSPGS